MGADARLTADPGLIAAADGVVLPGVGAFGACMSALRACGLEQPALDAVASGRPFLGICVGMQMLFDASEEDAARPRAGRDPGHDPLDPARREAPADAVEPARGPPAPTTRCCTAWATTRGSTSCTRCTACPTDPTMVAATCEYGGTLNAAFRHGNVFATQFHPEKSGPAGLRLLANFVSICAAERVA